MKQREGPEGTFTGGNLGTIGAANDTSHRVTQTLQENIPPYFMPGFYFERPNPNNDSGLMIETIFLQDNGSQVRVANKFPNTQHITEFKIEKEKYLDILFDNGIFH